MTGKSVGTDNVELKKGMVIILEGHYTLRSNLHKYIDLNIILLGEMEEFLKRKVDRVKDYRASDEAIDYFWRIDVPSFKNHLKYYGLNADVIIDNTDYNNPKIKNKKYIEYWCSFEHPKLLPAMSLETAKDAGEFVLSHTLLVPPAIKQKINDAITILRTWDSKVGEYLRTNINSLKSDLFEMITGLIEQLNQDIKDDDFHFKLTHTYSLQNVYYHRLPLSVSLALFSKARNKAIISILADAFQSELVLQIIWDGGYKKLSIVRELGDIAEEENSTLKDTTFNVLKTSSEKDPIKVMLPTHFTLPHFLKGLNYQLVFIRKEDEVISASQAFLQLLEEGGVWVHRFALFSELEFYQNVLLKVGAQSVQIGNYLLSMKHDSPELNERFRKFIKEWKKPVDQEAIFSQAHSEMDQLVEDERKEAKQFVAEKLKHFIMMDSHLFSQFMYTAENGVSEALRELKIMMMSRNRLLRKRANQYIQKSFPMISLKTKKLWKDIPEDSPEEISLQNYNRVNPSILAEVYLWMAIRDEDSSILANNIYDIRSRSIDSRAYLHAAAASSTPIVLQVSLNAVGQEEIDAEGKNQIGYLKVPNGPHDFVNSVMKSARDLYLKEGTLPPLFGIGLDHVSADYDLPEGRSRRFLDKALATGKITHYVPDGACLFDAQDRDNESLKRTYKEIAKFSCNLVSDLKSIVLLDREICAGELNYVGNSKQALVPSVEEMRLFMRCYQDALKEKGHLALLSRPTLFIGNLGTTHHGYDKVLPSIEEAKRWKDGLKNENFISPVLHGTTATHDDVLRRAATGCHKINEAGELLGIVVNNLPEKISRIIYESNTDPKRILASLRFLFDDMTGEETSRVFTALVRKCEELFSIIKSPKLTKMDSSYFHYNTYNYPAEHIDVMLDSVRKAIETYKSADDSVSARPDIKREFSASMIEVPEEEMKGLVETLWQNGIRHFHIDAGDGRFITRSFTGVNKAKFLKEKYPAAILHAHLMIKNPHFPFEGNVCPIQQYADAGCDAIAIHPRSFDNPDDIVNALRLIRNLGCRPGILIEVGDSFGKKLENLITAADLDWVIIMGVPIGYGGQIFQFTTLQVIRDVYEFSKKINKEFLIEVDGGLTMQTLELSKNAGGQIFDGWSIIKSKDLNILTEKVKAVNKILGVDAQ